MTGDLLLLYILVRYAVEAGCWYWMFRFVLHVPSPGFTRRRPLVLLAGSLILLWRLQAAEITAPVHDFRASGATYGIRALYAGIAYIAAIHMLSRKGSPVPLKEE